MNIIINGQQFSLSRSTLTVASIIRLIGGNLYKARLIEVRVKPERKVIEYVCLQDIVDLEEGMTFTVIER